MPKARQHAATAGGTPDDVEAAFYEALRTADVDALMACWADEDDIVCIHPGGARISGVAAIRAAFDAIFSHGGAIQVRPESIRRMDAVGGAVHSVLERIEVMSADGPMQAHVLATNVYLRTPQGWRLVLHHASPGIQDEVQDVSSAAPVLH
jgi:ketosteroid isomerase-like protein